MQTIQLSHIICIRNGAFVEIYGTFVMFGNVLINESSTSWNEYIKLQKPYIVHFHTKKKI